MVMVMVMVMTFLIRRDAQRFRVIHTGRSRCATGVIRGERGGDGERKLFSHPERPREVGDAKTHTHTHKLKETLPTPHIHMYY
jgi:hypothetical protein